MGINLDLSEVPIRENRLGAITGYSGSIKDLAGSSSGAGGCALKNRERTLSQTSSCSSGCCQGMLTGIRGAAVVNHAPLGCSGDTIAQNMANHFGEYFRGWEHTNIRLINTNMDESDTVFGGTDKLRNGIREAYRRFKPQAIFITTSCASGIIGDDIKGVVSELAGEIPVPIIPAHCEGFRTNIWATGFDAAFHAVLTGLVQPPRQRRPELVNIINFRGRAKQTITDLFAQVGLVPQFIVPFASVDELRYISEAAATLTICGTLGSYLGTALEEQYGVKYVKSLPPHGSLGMDSWLTGLGEATGKQKEIAELIAREKEKSQKSLEEVRGKLEGRTAVLGMGPSFGHAYIGVLQELGIKVLHGTSWHYDQQYDHGALPAATQRLADGEEDITFSVGDQQNYEMINHLQRLKPDLYFSRHPGTSVWAAKLGITAIPVVEEYTAFGYQGLVNFGWRIVDALTNRHFVTKLAQKVKLPYADWWYQQDPYTFLDREAA